MLFVSFALGLLVLTALFDGLLESQSNPNRDPETAELDGGSLEVALRRNRQGHYVTSGELNGLEVVFLLDTGATDVAIPAEIAAAAGLRRGPAGRAVTANGTVTVYSTRIDSLSIGNITLRDVPASITPSIADELILLGMSALRQVEFTQRGDTLTLRYVPGL